MSKEYCIADTHFGDSNILNYEGRPFNSVEEMNEVMIGDWNKTATVDDIIFILGDFAIPDERFIKRTIARLNGYKIFIMGNHDKVFEYSWWLKSGFDEVYKYPIIYKDWFMMSHEPMYINKNMPYGNVYGHVHSDSKYKDCSNQSYCVSVERINYRPVDLEYIVKRMKEV